MRNDSTYATAMRHAARRSRPLRCATCWGRVDVATDAAVFRCENGHQVAMVAYEHWRGQVMTATTRGERGGRGTGLVVGPSQAGIRTIDLGEVAYLAMARERRAVFEQWRTARWDPPSVTRLLDALVDEVCALHDRIEFLEARLAGRDRAAS